MTDHRTRAAEVPALVDDGAQLGVVATLLNALGAYIDRDGDIVLSDSGAFLYFDAETPGKPGGTWKPRY